MEDTSQDGYQPMQLAIQNLQAGMQMAFLNLLINDISRQPI